MTQRNSARERHNAAQKRYAQKLREAGLTRLCVWVPRDEALKDRIRDFADREVEHYFEG